MEGWRRIRWALVVVVAMCGAILRENVFGQAPAEQPPAPVVIGRDPTEPARVIGKQFLLKVWLSDVGGAGVQKIYAVRVGEDGNITVPGSPAQHAEGLTIAALEAQVAAPYKAASPNAKAFITVVDRSPPPPPPPPPPATQAATTKPAAAPLVAAAAPATAPTTAPAK